MISVLIVDDHPMVYEGIFALLSDSEDIKDLQYAKNGEECLSFLRHKQPDVILLDINLPDINGIDLCKTIKTLYTDIKILALSTYNQASYINKIISNGASGYLLKNVSKDELKQAIYAVVMGNSFNSIEVLETLKSYKTATGQIPLLTKRELDILKLVIDGLSNPQIGEKLYISPDTVDSHRKNLHTKLGVNNTASLVRFALENNLVQ